ncbi:hypothetical protein ACFW6S_31480 [Streptomyces sp. NPDC058740]|uniref:hypothetical protein n=1 Tax=Streptomyces sp. NPDC058740 TaxID=3346619 RepID=UPI0036C39423
MGENAHPVAIIDLDPAQAGSRVPAACVLVFTNWELRARFLALAPPSPPDVADQYVILTLDSNPTTSAVAALREPTSLTLSIPEQPTSGTRTVGSCTCLTPRLYAVFTDGPEAVEPCEDTTPASAFLTAQCNQCGGRYDGQWRRIPPSLTER